MQDEQAVALVKAIRDHAGLDLNMIREAAEHGADAGWSGFTYYSDTCTFYEENERLLWSILSDDAEEYGFENVPAFVASFKAADSADSETGFKNLVAWYALESAGSWLTMRRENRAA